MFLLTPLTPWCDTIPPSPFSHTDARTTPPLCFSSAHNCTHTYKHALTRTFQYQTNNNNKHKHTRIRSNTQTNNNNTQACTYASIPTPKLTTTIHRHVLTRTFRHPNQQLQYIHKHTPCCGYHVALGLSSCVSCAPLLDPPPHFCTC